MAHGNYGIGIAWVTCTTWTDKHPLMRHAQDGEA